MPVDVLMVVGEARGAGNCSMLSTAPRTSVTEEDEDKEEIHEDDGADADVTDVTGVTDRAAIALPRLLPWLPLTSAPSSGTLSVSDCKARPCRGRVIMR